MQLPNWETLNRNFPNLPAATVFTQIGGKVALNYEIGVFKNACATRISKALNGSGGRHKIPYYKAVGPNGRMEAQVSSGKNKNWHIFRVKILIKYLTEKYGSPSTYIPSEYKKEISGKKGIIIFEVNGWDDATGHADLWDGEDCVYASYDSSAHRILFWEAP
ncbi:type VI secretion system amidase effector protein Tae4 [Vibrio penaeicida]|uniref:Cytoplasmic protein n=2 Tax=Vibrio penaeicida TaxID=104609 RepID=A0AAV5NNB3_9VIBR|nr:type VI secretion system amidase effector protein Tae4 [Vibrio penaeicida]RTZ22154.1 hypothetical protein EKN09_15600 [Vibrio penaeicida]GLQ71506.1 hypothetical protein GCM10007932_08660 [Vibrio penaeicida]